MLLAAFLGAHGVPADNSLLTMYVLLALIALALTPGFAIASRMHDWYGLFIVEAIVFGLGLLVLVGV